MSPDRRPPQSPNLPSPALPLLLLLLLGACVAPEEEDDTHHGVLPASNGVSSTACQHARQPDPSPCTPTQVLTPAVDDRGCIMSWSCQTPACPQTEPPTCEPDQTSIEIEDADGCTITLCETTPTCQPDDHLFEASFDLSTEARRQLADALCADIEAVCGEDALFQTTEDPQAGRITCACICK